MRNKIIIDELETRASVVQAADQFKKPNTTRNYNALISLCASDPFYEEHDKNYNNTKTERRYERK